MHRSQTGHHFQAPAKRLLQSTMSFFLFLLESAQCSPRAAWAHRRQCINITGCLKFARRPYYTSAPSLQCYARESASFKISSDVCFFAFGFSQKLLDRCRIIEVAPTRHPSLQRSPATTDLFTIATEFCAGVWHEIKLTESYPCVIESAS